MTRTRIAQLALPIGFLVLTATSHVGPSSAQTTYMPGAEPPKPTASDTTLHIQVVPLARGVYAAKVSYVWTGWVELPEGILLIDSSMSDSTAAALADTIRARSGPIPVKYVVNTHAHQDHFGGNRYFVSRGATVIAQTKSAAKIDSIMAIPETTTGAAITPKLVKPSIHVDHRKVMGPPDRRVEIIWLGKPAHTAGDLIVYLPKQKTVFAGDLVSNQAIPWFLDPNWSRLGWLASLDSLTSKAFTIAKLVPGHGAYDEPWKGFKFTRGYLKDSYEKAAKMASWRTSVRAVRDWGYLGAYENAEFYSEVHYMNMRRLYNEARGMKTPGRVNAQTFKH